MCDSSQLSIPACIALIVLSGAAGGVIGALLKALTHICENLPDYDDASSVRAHQEMCSRMKSWRFYLGRSAVGIGGGFAVMLGGMWIEKIAYTGDTKNVIYLISLCVVAGTVAHKLVPGIGDRLQDELIRRQVKNVGRIAEEQAARTEKTMKASQNYTEVISHADAAFSTRFPADIQLAVKELTLLSETHPLDRTVHIYLGRLYRLIENYDRAILTLRTFIEHLDEERARAGRAAHMDMAAGAAYFNIACYHILKMREYKKSTHSETEIRRLYDEAIEALKRAVALDPDNLTATGEDDDLKEIHHESEWKKLLCT